ncbi:MAG: hypothetical protein J6T96_05080 [Bacteroidales bacterium]|nr:hypothetical protein [Bacteroidales bacterium]
MIYDFDYFNRYEQPQLILCQPDDREIGVIEGVSDLKMVINLNEVSTLSYKIYNNDEQLLKEGEAYGETKEWIPDESKPNVYRLHRERRQVHAVGIGYFIITEINEIEDDKGVYKNVSCKSCEYELNNITCPAVALKEVNMYPLYNTVSYSQLSNYERFRYLEDVTTVEVDENDTGVYESESCILFNILCYAPTWRLSDACVERFETVDKYRTLAAQMRNLEDEDTTIYSYLKKNVSEAWDCFISFNIEDRTIDIYTYNDVLLPSDMVLSEANILDKCEVKSNIDDYVNALQVSGGTDTLYISDFTNTGENVIYNFDHDIATGMIDGELKEAILHWEQLSDADYNLDIPEGANIPAEVFPDTLTGYEGNDLYQFLNETKKALENWSKAYEAAKAEGKDYKDYIAPPQIAVHTGASGEDDKLGEYLMVIRVPLAGPDGTSETDTHGADVLHITYGTHEVVYYPQGNNPALTSSEQTAEIIRMLERDTNLSGTGFNDKFDISTGMAFGETTDETRNNLKTYYVRVYNTNDTGRTYHYVDNKIYAQATSSDYDSGNFKDGGVYYESLSAIRFRQRTAGEGTPGFHITNNEKNISGLISLTIEEQGYTGGETRYTAILTDFAPDGEITTTEAKVLEWKQSFRPSGGNAKITTSEAKKVLQYLNDELTLTQTCYAYERTYKEAYEAQIAKLTQEQESSGFSDPSSIRNEVYQAEWADASTYLAIATQLSEAYASLANEIQTWVTTVEVLIDSRSYLHTFQGAFKDYYENKYNYELAHGDMGDSDIQKKAVSLYNRLTRLLKMQKYQDSSIVITDAMDMMEKYQQEEALYEKGVETLKKLIQPNAEITMDAEPFVFNPEYRDITKNVKMGYCLYVELPNGEVPLYHLNQITIDYEAPSCQLVFGDRIRSSDPADIFGDLQTASATAANIIASERIDWGVRTSAINYLMKEKDADIAATFRAMQNSVNNVVIDSHGLSCYSVNPETNEEEFGFWGANGALMFYKYENGERKPELAIGRMYKANGEVEYGFWGDKIIANTITAEKLAVGAITNGSNYIRNGSFEGISGVYGSTSSGYVADWKNNVGGTLQDINYKSYTTVKGTGSTGDNNIVYLPVGERCAVVEYGHPFEQTTEVLPAGKYTLSYYYKLAASGDQLRVGYKVYNSSTDDTTATASKNTINATYTGSTSQHNCGRDGKWQKEVREITVYEGQSLVITLVCPNPGDKAYVDGVMLSKGNSSEYTPHISEVYAKYTAVDEGGIRVYGGQIQVYDNDGTKRIYTEGNNFNVRGSVLADSIITTSGGSMAGWQIDEKAIYKLENNKMKMGISAYTRNPNIDNDKDYPAIWAGYTLNTSVPDVTKDNGYPRGFDAADSTDDAHGAKFMLLQDGSLYASNAKITGSIAATSLTLGSGANKYAFGVSSNVLEKTQDPVFNRSKTYYDSSGNVVYGLDDDSFEQRRDNLYEKVTSLSFNNDKIATREWAQGEAARQIGALDFDLGGWQVLSGVHLSTADLSNYFTYLYGNPTSGDDWVIRTGYVGSGYKYCRTLDDSYNSGKTYYTYSYGYYTEATGLNSDNFASRKSGLYERIIGRPETIDGNSVNTTFGVTADGRMYCHGAQVNGDIVCNTLTAGSIYVGNGNTKINGGATLGGSWTIGQNTLYTTVGASDNATYTLNNKNTFMLDASGNAYSLGHFRTRAVDNTSDLGIDISNYDISFKKNSSSVDEGAISFTGNGEGDLAISAKSDVCIGKKNNQNNMDYYFRFKMDPQNNQMCAFQPFRNIGTADLGSYEYQWNDLYLGDSINWGKRETGGSNIFIGRTYSQTYGYSHVFGRGNYEHIRFKYVNAGVDSNDSPAYTSIESYSGVPIRLNSIEKITFNDKYEISGQWYPTGSEGERGSIAFSGFYKKPGDSYAHIYPTIEILTFKDNPSTYLTPYYRYVNNGDHKFWIGRREYCWEGAYLNQVCLRDGMTNGETTFGKLYLSNGDLYYETSDGALKKIAFSN